MSYLSFTADLKLCLDQSNRPIQKTAYATSCCHLYSTTKVFIFKNQRCLLLLNIGLGLGLPASFQAWLDSTAVCLKAINYLFHHNLWNFLPPIVANCFSSLINTQTMNSYNLSMLLLTVPMNTITIAA